MHKEHAFTQVIKKNGYTVVNCKTCGFWHVYPIPTTRDLNRYYKKQYYEEVIGYDASMADKLKDPDGFYAMQYEDRLRRLNALVDRAMPITVLDIGAGYGDYLRFMRKKGWITQGFEPSKVAYMQIKDRKALGIKHGSIDRLAGMGFRPATVVALNNVLEHLREPEKTLGVVREKLLSPGGVLMLIVPNDFSEIQDLVKHTTLAGHPEKQHYWVNPLEHLNHWSHRTIRTFLGNCGFKVKHFTADFPMEFFSLMGEDYVTDPSRGRSAHLKRVMFEKRFAQAGRYGLKDELFKALAAAGLGRNLQIFAEPKG